MIMPAATKSVRSAGGCRIEPVDGPGRVDGRDHGQVAVGNNLAASGTQASTISTANPVIAGGRNTTRTANATSTTGTVSPMYAARKMPAAASPLACGAASAAAYDTARIPHTNRAINNPGSVLHTRKMAADNTSVSNP